MLGRLREAKWCWREAKLLERCKREAMGVNDERFEIDQFLYVDDDYKNCKEFGKIFERSNTFLRVNLINQFINFYKHIGS